MKKEMILELVIALYSFHIADGLECLTCTNARSQADCIAQGEMVTCQEDQQMSCESIIRYGSGAGQLPLITKRCKQTLACENDQSQQNDQCDEENGVCRCCCQEDGCNRDNFWCSSEARCDLLETPRNGNKDCVFDGNEGELGSTCTFSCDSGFVLTGVEVSVCAEGTGGLAFTSASPECTRDDTPPRRIIDARCELLMLPENGGKTCEFDVEEGEVGAVCAFACNDGYALMGNDRSECRLDGERAIFNNPSPVCQIIMVIENIPDDRDILCEELQAPANGDMICDFVRIEGEIDTTCVFRCNEGFELRGSERSVCRRIGESTAYTELAPSCQKILVPTTTARPAVVDNCQPNPCGNGGACVNLDDGYACACHAGFSGRNCEIDACGPNPCLNGGRCSRVANNGGYTCSCRQGFRGVNCGIEIRDPCQGNPCGNGGTCVRNGRGGYVCNCEDGFSGANCEIDACNPNRCLNGACTRANNLRGYNCLCNPGFGGENCGQEIVVDPCQQKPCQNGGACSNLGGGRYSCTCRPGFSGSNCGIDACSPNRCLNGAACNRARNARGYVCRCSEGYRGLNCGQVDVNPCQENPCRNGGACSVVSAGYVCACQAGFSGSNCQIDACNPNRCLNGGTCNRARNQRRYVCSCPDNFRGENCGEEKPDPCRLNPCQNGGLCSRVSGGYVCSCRPGFSGGNCQSDVCSPNQCLNGGSCVRTRNQRGFVCRCAEGFQGTNCGQNVNPCDLNPCRNGGVCSSTRGAYSCRCRLGFSGRNCGVDVCNPNRCLNGGICNPASNSRGFTCTCRRGFTGANCGISDPCQNNPCQNGGSCSRAPGGFTCTCAPGFSGANCINDACSPDPCRNGGVCSRVRGGRGYTCTCARGFRGANCGQAIRCDLLVEPENGEKVCVFSDFEGEIASVCTFTCDAGYRLVGLTTSTCRLSGQIAEFDVPAPTCVRIFVETTTLASNIVTEPPSRITTGCDVWPAAPENGFRSCFQSRGTVACIYFCGKDEYMIGKSVLTCTPSTGFDGTPPRCLRPGRCDLPESLQNGELACLGSGEVGTKCNFRCNAGGNLIGQTESQCVMVNGKARWSCDVPTCL